MRQVISPEYNMVIVMGHLWENLLNHHGRVVNIILDVDRIEVGFVRGWRGIYQGLKYGITSGSDKSYLNVIVETQDS